MDIVALLVVVELHMVMDMVKVELILDDYMYMVNLHMVIEHMDLYEFVVVVVDL